MPEEGRTGDPVDTSHTLVGTSARSVKRVDETAAAAAAANGFVGVRLRGTLGRSSGLIVRLGETPSDGGTIGVISLDRVGAAGIGVVGLDEVLTAAV